MRLSEVQKDVVQAYADWMLQKKTEVVEYFNNPETPVHYKQSVRLMFQQLDDDGSGIVQLEELLAWAAQKNPKQGSKVPDEFITAQFTRVDLDGSGGLDFEECLLLQYLGCLNMLWCGCCGAFIDATKEDGFTCATCYGKFGPRDQPGQRQLDLCIKCHDSGKADDHIALAGDHHSFVRLSEITTPETVTCACCAQEHGLVLGYMQGDDGDRHVRPVPGDLESWLCELCALTYSPESRKFAWKTTEPKKGLLFVPAAGGIPAGQTSPKDRWITSSMQRKAPHCKTCKEALVAGTMPFPVEAPPSPPPTVEAVAQGVEKVALVAAVVVAAPPLLVAQQAVCVCCQDVHDVTSALDSATVKGYLYASGFSEHMKKLGDGKFVCEWCAKYICEKCGTHYADTAKPSLFKWSVLRACPPSEFCEATKWGGMVSVQSGMRKKADDMSRGHCRDCRYKILTDSMLGRINTGTIHMPGSPVVPPQQTVVCICCKEIHDVTSALNGNRVPAYVHKDDFPEHTKPLTDGRFVCEWCSKWKCHRCGTLKWTDTRPEIGLWSETTYYCKGGCKPKEGGPHLIEKSMLRATAHDLSRSHCRTCKEKIIAGTLAERFHEAKAPPAGNVSSSNAPPAKPPKKGSDVKKVLGGKKADESCSIQ